MQFSKKYNSVARILLGILFLFSGLTKAVNPYGFSVKIGEYLSALSMNFLSFMTPEISISVIALEIVLAGFLFCRIFQKFSSWMILVISSVFTLLTLWNLLFDTVGDCGCFGDVIKLSPLVSFLKNLLILLITVIFHMSVKEECAGNHRILLVSFIVVISVMLPVYVYHHLPLYDTSGYQVGTNLMQSGNREFPMFRDDFIDVSEDVLSSSDTMLVVIIQSPENQPDLTKIPMRTIALSAYDLPGMMVEHYSSDYSLLKQVLPNPYGGALLVCNGKILNKWAMKDCPYLKK